MTDKQITIISRCSVVLAVLALCLNLISMVKECNNESQDTTVPTSYTLVPFNIDCITDMTYIDTSGTYWVECGSACEHYATKKVFFNILKDIDNPDSIRNNYYVMTNTDGETEIIIISNDGH